MTRLIGCMFVIIFILFPCMFTLNKFQAWLTEINEYAQEDVVIMLLGNKADMAGERLIKTEDGEKLAKVSSSYRISSTQILL